ncbi:MAG: UDP-N-acetylmuramate--L-alanine ligase [Gemmatimonadetes bacterium]|nr:UDP-N-acetylmuramate--L-alanine ligase [Gemmatimonadota bacterium]
MDRERDGAGARGRDGALPPASSAHPVAAAAADLLALARRGPVHFMGICGAGMSALAEMVLRAGGRVSGCDLHLAPGGETLRALGADIVEGHDPAHVAEAVAVVVTAAVPQDHPELNAGRRRGIPVLKRAQALGSLVNRGRVVAVAGTHGKTTSTAMATLILEAAGLHPTGIVGGKVPAWGSGLRAGSMGLFVVEADEYDRSFLTLEPAVAVVTTVEADHLDVFGSLDAVEDAFAEFAGRVSAEGLVVACVDDAGARRVLDRITGPRRLAYGTGAGAGLRAVDIELRPRGSRFTVVDHGEVLGAVTLAVPGLHNVRNALGAFAAARELGADLEAAQRALAGFRGVARRFQELGEVGGIAVVDDYAHHPTEIEATLTAARHAFPGRRLVAAFQPHLYSRTRDFAEAFGRALAAADAVWVTGVYAAREAPMPGVTGELIVDATRRAGGRGVRYHADIASLPDALAEALRPGDVCIAMGAGSIDAAAQALVARLRRGAGS